MQQATINFTAQAQAQVTLAERVRNMSRSVTAWLDSESKIYTKIASFSVTRRVVIRVNLVTLAMLIAIVAVETAPVAALAAALSVAWLMYRTMLHSAK